MVRDTLSAPLIRLSRTNPPACTQREGGQASMGQAQLPALQRLCAAHSAARVLKAAAMQLPLFLPT